MYKVWNERVYSKILGIGKEKPKIVVETLLQSIFSSHNLSHICVSLSQYLEFLGKLFCFILCTYSKVFYTHVFQSVMCNPFAMGVNLFKHKIGSCTANTEECTVNYFHPTSIHIGL